MEDPSQAEPSNLDLEALASSDMWIAEAWQVWGFADDFQSVTNWRGIGLLISWHGMM